MDRNDPAVKLRAAVSQWRKLLVDHQGQDEDDYDQLARAHEALRCQMASLSVCSNNCNLDEVASGLVCNLGMIKVLQGRRDNTLEGILHQIQQQLVDIFGDATIDSLFMRSNNAPEPPVTIKDEGRNERRQKATIRKWGPSLLRKAVDLGAAGSTTSVAFFWDITQTRWRCAVHIPTGMLLPDANEIIANSIE